MSESAVASEAEPVVGIVMGSDSDWPVLEAASQALAQFGIAHEVDVVSAHRMPEQMLEYGRDAAGRGLRVLIAGAGGAAHLPGMLASVTPLPVIGVPVPLKYLDGMDSLLVDRADARGGAGGDGVDRCVPATPACWPCGFSRPDRTRCRSTCVRGWWSSRPRWPIPHGRRVRRSARTEPAEDSPSGPGQLQL